MDLHLFLLVATPSPRQLLRNADSLVQPYLPDAEVCISGRGAADDWEQGFEK